MSRQSKPSVAARLTPALVVKMALKLRQLPLSANQAIACIVQGNPFDTIPQRLAKTLKDVAAIKQDSGKAGREILPFKPRKQFAIWGSLPDGIPANIIDFKRMDAPRGHDAGCAVRSSSTKSQLLDARAPILRIVALPDAKDWQRCRIVTG
jgi:hypothetical protein